MAVGAEGYEIVGRVVPQAAASLDVVDLKIAATAAALAAPAISLEDLPVKFPVCLCVEL